MTTRAVVRLGAACCAAFALARCAHVEPPSGGPEDKTPPAVTAVYPAPGQARVPDDARFVFQFSEWIDRAATRGAILVSPPYAGRVRAEVDGDRLVVRLPAGARLRPSTTHDVTVLGNVRDLRGNAMGRPFTLRFTTGDALDSAAATGTLAAPGARGTLVAALYATTRREAEARALNPRDADFAPAALPEPWRELPVRVAAADSAGRYRIDGAAPGTYALFAFEDVNGNFAFDAGLERAATGPLSLALEPVADAPALRLAPLDTLPLRAAEVSFEAAAAPDSSGLLPGLVRLRFTREAHPRRAAMAARYRILHTDGDSTIVQHPTDAFWCPVREAWVLETPPLAAGVEHRVAFLRPDHPGRDGADTPDTSVVFVPEASDATAFALTPLLPAAPSGLPARAQVRPTLPAAGSLLFASSQPLIPARLDSLRARLEVRTGTDTVPARVTWRRVNVAQLEVRLPRALATGERLRIDLRPGPGDTAKTDSIAPAGVAYTGGAADSTQRGTLRVARAALTPARSGWLHWIEPVSGTAPRRGLVPDGDSLVARDVDAGKYRLLAFGDSDGDGVWHPGALRPWRAQEPVAVLLDTVTIAGPSGTDATMLLRDAQTGANRPE